VDERLSFRTEDCDAPARALFVESGKAVTVFALLAPLDATALSGQHISNPCLGYAALSPKFSAS
jgi:hypothetical protein